jgi:hypothetical protein
MSVQEEREPWWISTDGRVAIFGQLAEWGTWSMWYDDVQVIEGSLTTVCNYYQAEFYQG